VREAGRGKVGRRNGGRGVGKFRDGELGSGGSRAGDLSNLKSENIRRTYRRRYVPISKSWPHIWAERIRSGPAFMESIIHYHHVLWRRPWYTIVCALNMNWEIKAFSAGWLVRGWRKVQHWDFRGV
jgi:hypothetical protein